MANPETLHWKSTLPMPSVTLTSTGIFKWLTGARQVPLLFVDDPSVLMMLALGSTGIFLGSTDDTSAINSQKGSIQHSAKSILLRTDNVFVGAPKRL